MNIQIILFTSTDAENVNDHSKICYIYLYVYISLKVLRVFFCIKIKYFEKYKIRLPHSASTNLFSLTQIKIGFLNGLK